MVTLMAEWDNKNKMMVYLDFNDIDSSEKAGEVIRKYFPDAQVESMEEGREAFYNKYHQD